MRITKMNDAERQERGRQQSGSTAGEPLGNQIHHRNRRRSQRRRNGAAHHRVCHFIARHREIERMPEELVSAANDIYQVHQQR